ncbi:MAG: HAD-IA family hydrolase [Actinomycetota bacterium]
MRAVLLDVDGVLLNSAEAFRTVWQTWATRHALDFDPVWAATHGRRPIDTIEEVAGHLNSGEEYAQLQMLVDDPGLRFPPMEGAEELLAALPRDRWALVTSSHAGKVRARFARVGLPVPKVVVDGTSVTRGKPAPDCYLLAAELLGTDPAACLVVEDAPAGVEAALAAGARVVGITATHPASALSNAHTLVGCLQEVRPLVEHWLTDQA